MAWEQNPYAVKISLVAAADLSTSQYCFVKLVGGTAGAGNITGTPSATGATSFDRPIGILQNPAKTGFEAEVTVSGVTKAVAGATNIAIGDALTVGASGYVAKATFAASSTNYVLGTALSPSTAVGDVITVVINTGSAVRALA